MILAAVVVFRLAGETVTPAAAASVPRAVGSLQKPWVAAAWAEAHPDEAPPLLDCTAASGCWNPSGHGRVDLPLALSRSCNTYFLALARATPEAVRARALENAGFTVPRPLSPEASIGLGRLEELPRVAPSALLRAYRELLRRPWPSRDDLRLALVDGMRAAARNGTGAAFSSHGVLVKTGTVPSLEGRPLATSGWALASTAGGESLALALLPDGTGAEAAAALGEELDETGHAARSVPGARPGRPLPQTVRVRLLETLRPSRVRIANAGASPAPLRRAGSRESWLGGGGQVDAEPGLVVGPGLLRLDVEPYGLVRYVEGGLEVGGRTGAPRLVLSASPRAWVDGVLRGELRESSPGLKLVLAAAALRFLREGPRHGREDLCDTTHCAVFAGRGPLVTWITPRRAELPADARSVPPPVLDDDGWEAALALAARPGPARFTGHCGGASLSPREVWGRGSPAAFPCPRHGPSDGAPWERLLPSSALASAFGGPVLGLYVRHVAGVRKTRVRTEGRTVDLLYDDLHRSLAPELGWDALPSPPDSFERVDAGFLARGRGRGHRVGLCLAPSSR